MRYHSNSILNKIKRDQAPLKSKIATGNQPEKIFRQNRQNENSQKQGKENSKKTNLFYDMTGSWEQVHKNL